MAKPKYTRSQLEDAAREFYNTMTSKEDTNKPWHLKEIDEVTDTDEKSEFSKFINIVQETVSERSGEIPYLDGLLEAHKQRPNEKNETYTRYTALLASVVNMYFLRDFKDNQELFDSLAKEIVKQRYKDHNDSMYHPASDLGEEFKKNNYYGNVTFNLDRDALYIYKIYENNLALVQSYKIKEDGKELYANEEKGPWLLEIGGSHTGLRFAIEKGEKKSSSEDKGKILPTHITEYKGYGMIGEERPISNIRENIIKYFSERSKLEERQIDISK